MTLKEKYEWYREVFFKHFVYLSDSKQTGANIPLQEIVFGEESNIGYVGDGTINMANYMTYLVSCLYLEDNENERSGLKTLILDCLESIDRLIERPYNDAKQLYKNIPFKKEKGFFVRDDFDGTSELEKEISLSSCSYNSVTFNDQEDPCHSAYVSQDQIWNLTPILRFLAYRSDVVGPVIAVYANDILREILEYVIDNNHTIYDPYFSTILHYKTYVPTFNTDKVAPWNRKKDREEHLKYKVKVKRGANNWYYAYGFRRTYNEVAAQKCNRFKSFFYSLLYYPLIFLADRIWWPTMQKVFGKSRKDNSIYCLGVSGKVWYSNRRAFLKRLQKRFNQDIENYVFTCFLESITQENFSKLDKEAIDDYLNSYLELDTVSQKRIQDPVPFLLLYNFRQIIN